MAGIAWVNSRPSVGQRVAHVDLEARMKAIEAEWATVFERWKSLEGKRYREKRGEKNAEEETTPPRPYDLDALEIAYNRKRAGLGG